MNPSESREITALHKRLREVLHEDAGIGHPTTWDAASAILAMPEMQAIRLVLSDAMVVLGYDDDPIKQQSKIARLGESWDELPASVKAWVTS